MRLAIHELELLKSACIPRFSNLVYLSKGHFDIFYERQVIQICGKTIKSKYLVTTRIFLFIYVFRW